MIVQPHKETLACTAVHCDVHQVDEFCLFPFLICGHCNHTYKSGFELKRRYRWAMRPWQREKWVPRYKLLWAYVFAPRARNLAYCPVCSHDFGKDYVASPVDTPREDTTP